MKLYLVLFIFPFIQSQVFGRVITSNLETNQDVDVYSIQEDKASHTITMISPKSAKPTLREIIYYHVIEKPYDNNENVITTTDSPVTTELPVTTEAPIITDATTNLIDDPTKLFDNTDVITNVNDVEHVTTKSLEEIYNFGDVSTDNSNVYNEIGEVNTDTPIESNTDGVTSLNEAVDTDVVISTDAPIVLSTSNESLDSDDNNSGFNEVNFGSLSDDSVSENISLDGTAQYNPEAINMDSLTRSRRDLADTPNTYGMDLSGDQGTVWNDVSAKGVKFDVGDPNFENMDDDVQITDEFVNTAIQDPQIKEDIDNTQTEIMDENEDNFEIINKDHIETSTINPFLKSLPEEQSETIVDQSDLETTMDEEKSVTSDSETTINNSNSVTSDIKTKIDVSESVNSDWEANVDQSDSVNTDLKSIADESKTVNSDLETTVDQSETVNSDMKSVEKQDTKLWGMNLNQNSGTVWNDFGGSTVEYGVGNNGNIAPDLNPLPAVNFENSESITSSTDNPINPDIAEPIPIVPSVPDENIGASNETEDSDDFFVTPSTKDLIHESTDLPTGDTISIIQEQDIEEETMVPANEEVASDITENSEIMNIPEGPTLPPLDLDNLPGFMDITESSGDMDANSATTEDSMEFRNLPIDDNESLIDDITRKYDNMTDANDSNVEDNLLTTEINLDAYGTEVSLDSTTEIPLDSTTDFDMAIDENDDKITDDLTDLLKNRKFFNWIQTWAAAYSEMFHAKIAELVKEEVTKQIGELELNCCQKNIEGNTENIDMNDNQEKVRIDSNTIYGNAVGNDNVTNMFLFFDKNNDKILEILKPLIDKSSDKSNLVHYISPNLETSTDNNESTKLVDDAADILDSTIDNLDTTTEELPLKNYKIKTRINKYLSPEWMN